MGGALDRFAPGPTTTRRPGSVPLDTRRIGRLEQELRTLALDNAFGRVGDEDYLRRKTALAAEIEEARRPSLGQASVDPARARAWLGDLRSLWEVDLPERPEHASWCREYEGVSRHDTGCLERGQDRAPPVPRRERTRLRLRLGSGRPRPRPGGCAHLTHRIAD